MFKPRTIRGKLVVGLLVFELLLVAVFAFFVVHEHTREVRTRDLRRLEFQANMFALLSREAVAANNLDVLRDDLRVMMQAPSISGVRITDPAGGTIVGTFKEATGGSDLSSVERKHLLLNSNGPVLELPDGKLEGHAPVIINGEPKAIIWIYPNDQTQRSELYAQLRLTLAFAIVGALGCALLAEYLARSITRPLARLLGATRRIIRDPVDTSTLAPDEAASSEVSDLTLAFNLMVSSIEEQRTGLSDTLGLLDSMLAHAPIGLAFFDDHARFIRMNQFFADMNDVSVVRHLGRNVAEILPGATGRRIELGILNVFATSEAVRDIEVSVASHSEDTGTSTWLVNIYPVRRATEGVRWVGAVVVDTTAIKLAEDALRRAEKLAAVGRLSASIAHEINNPLEAITNLLYLLRHVDHLNETAASYAELAAHEVDRMSEIVQQTLRFHRQSTRKAATKIAEILDSVVSLNRGRVHSLQVEVVRRYRSGVELLCFAGEMRQLFANLIGNALDAMPEQEGRLLLSLRYSQSWRNPSQTGVRIVIADTGSGMNPATRRRIFEPFFTTKEATGTGLGLWVSAEIIQKHGGTVRIRSKVTTEKKNQKERSGTVFMVFFPHEPDSVEAMPEIASGHSRLV